VANILVSVEHGLEVAAEDVLKVVPFLNKVITAGEKVEPAVVAALGVLLGAVSTALTATATAATSPLNISLDSAAASALESVWPDVVAFAKTIGITI
jgi:hypothetical protein